MVEALLWIPLTVVTTLFSSTAINKHYLFYLFVCLIILISEILSYPHFPNH